MGNARFYWYPDSDGTIEILDLAEPISDVQVTPVRVASDAYSARGGQHRTTIYGALKVRIVLERFTDADLAWKIESMQSHLERGGSVGFTTDSAKAWCAGHTSLPDRGDPTLPTGGNLFKAWESSAALSTGDIVAIVGGQPEGIVEYAKIDSVAGDDITLVNAVKHSVGTGPAAVRYRDFWPILRMPSSQLGRAIVTHDHRISYTLDMELQTDPATLGDLVTADVNLVGDSLQLGTHLNQVSGAFSHSASADIVKPIATSLGSASTSISNSRAWGGG